MTLVSDVAAAARKLAEAREQSAAAREELEQIIRAALTEGWSAAVVADAAGITRARVYQIRDGRR